MIHPLRCRCGTLQGAVLPSSAATRAICYCNDCQAHARFLGGDVVDRSGGTEVLATAPRYVQLRQGLGSLACLSLSSRGLLRWYAQCCRTPIGNTPRNPGIAYVGLVHVCLGDEPARQASFGPVRMAVNTKSAHGPVASPPLGSRALAAFNLVRSLAGARLPGGGRPSPFFEDGSRTPIRVPYVLSAAERAQACRGDAG